ncbi:MAG: hypothetical protein K2Q18_14590 [Bdellovibrionales bacterium]|nr:hypothetical protein [Bdellovibrionales bacterium]
MDILNYLFPFSDFVLPLTLNKINKHYFGKDIIKLDSGKDLYDYLVSPADIVFMRVESDDYEKFNIRWGDVVIIERNDLKYEGPVAVKIDNRMVILDFKISQEISKGEYFGTIAYVLYSEEEDFLDMIGQELFLIT